MFSLFTMSAYADKTTRKADVIRWGRDSVMHGIERAPSQLPSIVVIYDSETHIIEFLSSMECNASVFIYDANGNLIASANSLDAILCVSDNNLSAFHILIESDNWYATAVVENI